VTLSLLGKDADEGSFWSCLALLWESYFQLSKIRAVGIWHMCTVHGFFSDSFCLKVAIFRHGVTDTRLITQHNRKYNPESLALYAESTWNAIALMRNQRGMIFP
jgi:hypothetical protein